MQTSLHGGRRAISALRSLTHPSREFFDRQLALLRKTVPAGLPVGRPAGYRPGLDERIIQHKDSTFFMRIAGAAMSGLGIFDGDLLMVDRAAPAASGCVIIAVVDGEFTVRQLLHTPHGPLLRAAHLSCPDVLIKPEQDFSIWGVVQWNVHKA